MTEPKLTDRERALLAVFRSWRYDVWPDRESVDEMVRRAPDWVKAALRAPETGGPPSPVLEGRELIGGEDVWYWHQRAQQRGDETDAITRHAEKQADDLRSQLRAAQEERGRSERERSAIEDARMALSEQVVALKADVETLRKHNADLLDQLARATLERDEARTALESAGENPLETAESDVAAGRTVSGAELRNRCRLCGESYFPIVVKELAHPGCLTMEANLLVLLRERDQARSERDALAEMVRAMEQDAAAPDPVVRWTLPQPDDKVKVMRAILDKHALEMAAKSEGLIRDGLIALGWTPPKDAARARKEAQRGE